MNNHSPITFSVPFVFFYKLQPPKARQRLTKPRRVRQQKPADTSPHTTLGKRPGKFSSKYLHPYRTASVSPQTKQQQRGDTENTSLQPEGRQKGALHRVGAAKSSHRCSAVRRHASFYENYRRICIARCVFETELCT